jgi:hypothetical protein
MARPAGEPPWNMLLVASSSILPEETKVRSTVAVISWGLVVELGYFAAPVQTLPYYTSD